MSSAKAAHPAPMLFAPSRIVTSVEDGTTDGAVAPRPIWAKTAMRNETSTIAQEANPGRTRFHGNGMGGGVAASRRTASITLVTKPDEGTTSSSPESIRSRLSCIIIPPPCSVSPKGAELCGAGFPSRGTVLPSPCPPANRGSALRQPRPYRGNRKESARPGTSAEGRRPHDARRDRDPHPRALRRWRADLSTLRYLRATRLARAGV